MSKVLIIGIDSLDSTLLSRFEADLPNFRKLKERSPHMRLTSIFPPDSVPAWVSIYTGLNPARHGVINFINPADKTGKVLLTDIDNSSFQGNTFWDFAAMSGKKVCLVLPYAVYPAYPINGSMVCRTMKVVPSNYPLSTFPTSLSRKYQAVSSKLNLFHGFPSARQLTRCIKSFQECTLAEAELGLNMLQGEEWELFFMYFSAIDAVQHTFWSYFDETHPSYPGNNPHQDVIKNFYVLCDEMIGKFITAVGSDTAIIVLSDHGHGMRPVKLVNINEILRRKGLLVPKRKGLRSRNPLYETERLKRIASNFVTRYGIGNSALRLMQRFPLWKRIFASPASIDWEKTTAYVSDLSAIKSYSYGGVIVNKANLADTEYEKMQHLLIKELAEIREPDTGEHLVRWICRREELYSGEYISKYPDILFELTSDYGIGWEIGGSLVGTGYMHRVQPGSHTRYSPVLLVSTAGAGKCLRKDITPMDISPSVLELLGISVQSEFDGESIF